MAKRVTARANTISVRIGPNAEIMTAEAATIVTEATAMAEASQMADRTQHPNRSNAANAVK
jgi:hypothetical protein